jgi:hypothetical protein
MKEEDFAFQDWSGEEIIRRLNECYADSPDEEDRESVRFSNASIARILEDDPW